MNLVHLSQNETASVHHNPVQIFNTKKDSVLHWCDRVLLEIRCAWSVWQWAMLHSTLQTGVDNLSQDKCGSRKTCSIVPKSCLECVKITLAFPKNLKDKVSLDRYGVCFLFTTRMTVRRQTCDCNTLADTHQIYTQQSQTKARHEQACYMSSLPPAQTHQICWADCLERCHWDLEEGKAAIELSDRLTEREREGGGGGGGRCKKQSSTKNDGKKRKTGANWVFFSWPWWQTDLSRRRRPRYVHALQACTLPGSRGTLLCSRLWPASILRQRRAVQSEIMTTKYDLQKRKFILIEWLVIGQAS